MLHRGIPIASDEKADGLSPGNMPIEKLILQARNSIFDEELYHELNREACNLANQGVRCIGDAISLPYGAERQIEIDLTPIGVTDIETSQDNSSNIGRNTPTSDIIIIKSISMSLRILLSHAHNQNLARRSQPPPPIRETKTSRPIYAILKPTLEMIRHRSDVQDMRAFLGNLRKTFLEASLNFKIEDSNIAPDLKNLPTSATSITTSVTDALVDFFTAPFRSSMTILCPSSFTSIKIEVHTNFFPPTFGTSYHATIISFPPTSPLADLPQIMQFSTTSTLENHILHLLTLDLVWLIFTSPGSNSNWATVSFHEGRLVSKSRERKITRTFTILVEKDRLTLAWDGVGGGTSSSHTLRWGTGEEAAYLGKGLLAIIDQERRVE